MTKKSPIKRLQTMNYAIFVNTYSEAALIAAENLLNQNQALLGVFFYQDAVYTAQAEIDLGKEWQTLADAHHIPLAVCVSSLERRHIEAPQMHEGFKISSLGIWMEWMQKADHVLSFGD